MEKRLTKVESNMNITPILYAKVSLALGLSLYTLSASASPYTLLDINGQSTITLPGLKVRLKLDNVYDGPRDKFCTNSGAPVVRKDSSGNFLDFVDSHGRSYTYTSTGQPVTYTSLPALNAPLENERQNQQTAINAWGTISLTKRFVSESLHEILPRNSPALVRWNAQKPVKLYSLDRGSQNNAYFSPDDNGGSIHFFSLVNHKNQIIGSTGNDYEIGSHETGHNISDILRPNHDLMRPQTGAIDESFGDYIAFSTALSVDSIRKQFLKDTQGNLRRSSFLSETAESLSQATGYGVHGIRNAVNDFTLDGSACEVHDLSRVFTGALYDIFVGAFEEASPRPWIFFRDELKDDEQINQVNKDLRALVLGAHCMVPYSNPTFADYGHTMYSLAENNPHYTYLSKFIPGAFENRGIDVFEKHNNFSACDKNAVAAHGVGGSKDNHICGTLEHLKKRKERRIPRSWNLEF